MSNSSADDSWNLQQHAALLRCGSLTATIDTAHPDRGLQKISFRSEQPDWKLLAVTANDTRTWPAIIADNYVRGNDLVAVYQEADAWPYAPQIYWSAEQSLRDPGIFASLRLTVSIQTHLLDTHPRVNANSRLHSNDALIITLSDDGEALCDGISTRERQFDSEGGDCCLLRRLPGGEISYAEFMPATDFRQLHVSRDTDGTCRAQWELFSEFLEKGVIRKAQVHTALLTPENDIEVAAEWCRQMRTRPLPLTT